MGKRERKIIFESVFQNLKDGHIFAPLQIQQFMILLIFQDFRGILPEWREIRDDCRTSVCIDYIPRIKIFSRNFPEI